MDLTRLSYELIPREVAGVLLPEKWNRHVQYAWRFDPCELGMQRQQQRTARRPRVQPDCSDEEYLPTEDELEDDHEHAMSE